MALTYIHTIFVTELYTFRTGSMAHRLLPSYKRSICTTEAREKEGRTRAFHLEIHYSAHNMAQNNQETHWNKKMESTHTHIFNANVKQCLFDASNNKAHNVPK